MKRLFIGVAILALAAAAAKRKLTIRMIALLMGEKRLSVRMDDSIAYNAALRALRICG